MSRIATVLLAGGGLLLAALAAADETRWSRPVEVARPGWVLIELDGRAAEHALTNLALLGPDGREVDISLYGPAPVARPVQVVRVTPGDGGWQVELDAGAAPPLHDRLYFALAKETAADGVLLEGSDDGRAWQPLARGNLFRLGSNEELQNLEIAYEPTRLRRLRLSWPLGAGLPELRDTLILPAEDGGVARPVPIECSGEGSILDCRISPPAECSTIEVALAPQEAPLGYHLFGGCDSEWEEHGEGERRQHGPLKLGIACGLPHRLRLRSALPPRVEGASCRPRGNRLGFEAEAAGAYRLVYGGLVPRPRRTSDTRYTTAPASTVPAEVGPEVAGKAPEWPAAAAPGVKLQGEWDHSWPIERSAAKGRLVALPLPAEVRLAAGQWAPGLRIDAGGAQLPFVTAQSPQPELLLATTLHPAPVADQPGRSRAEIRAAGASGKVSFDLYASGPFERRVRFLHPPDDRRQRERGGEIESPSHWSCPASLARGCLLRTRLGLPSRFDSQWDRQAAAGEGPAFLVEFDDGDNPPLRELEAELWIAGTVLYFVDPGGPLVLRWDSDLGEPSYDFAGLREVLPISEAAPARLGPELPAGRPLDAPRWLLPLAVGLAALALLAVLARMIRQDRT